MNQLRVVNQNGKLLVDSREVAQMIDKNHADLLRDIRRYMEFLGKSNFALADFFIESYYNDTQRKPRLHYLITKKGCEMVANKMTGEKGVLFTAAYVTKFEEMENALKPTSIEDLIIMQAQSVKELKQEVAYLKESSEAAHHRIDNIDKIDVIGDPQQRLNKMVRKYAAQNGLTFQEAWKHFRQAFNTAYHTNITMLVENYKMKHGIRTLSVPEYLSKVDRLADAIRVADKMLNSKAS